MKTLPRISADDRGSEEPNLKNLLNRALDLNPRESALIRGKNPWLFSVPRGNFFLSPAAMYNMRFYVPHHYPSR